MFRLLICGVLACLPLLAQADAGVPMLALAWPAQWLALLPIIGLETLVLCRKIGFSWRLLVRPVTKANLASTLIGIPIAWIAMFCLEMLFGIGISQIPNSEALPKFVEYALFPFTAAWVGGDSVWQVYAAFVILTIPFCWISIIIENRILRRALPEVTPVLVKRATGWANIASYVLLSMLALLFPLLG